MDISETLGLFAKETDGKKNDAYIELFRRKYRETLESAMFCDVLNDRKLAFLVNSLVKKRAIADHIASRDDMVSTVNRLCSSTDAKARKNAYSTVAALKCALFLDAIEERLKEEDVRFTFAPLIEAYYACGGRFEDLNAFMGKIEVDDPHYADVEKAYNAGRPRVRREVSSEFPCGFDVLLTCPQTAANVLLSDIKANGHSGKAVRSGVILPAEAANELCGRIRTYDEAMLFVGEYDEIFGKDEGSFAADLDSALRRYTAASYRIEYRHKGSNESRLKKMGKIKSIAENCVDGSLVNSVSDYDVEIRVTEWTFGVEVCIKTCRTDSRFAYRINDVPASVKPSTAAIVCAITGKYAPCHTGVVADFFCGSGTMLIEWYKRYGATHLIGVDISEKAVEKAANNAAAADAPITFVRGDALDVTIGKPADVIISNMPFGNRVGDHKSNEKLYDGFFGRIADIISGNAVTALYTTEKKLVRSCAAKYGFNIAHERVLDSGGMSPSLFILKRKEK